MSVPSVVCCCDESKLITFAESRNNYLQHPAKKTMMSTSTTEAKMLNVKEAIQDMGGADVVARLIPGATKNIVYHWSSANRVGPRFYLRFLELCNKMKVKVDPIKVMNGDKND